MRESEREREGSESKLKKMSMHAERKGEIREGADRQKWKTDRGKECVPPVNDAWRNHSCEHALILL